MTRSTWKGPFCEITENMSSFEQSPENIKKLSAHKTKIWSRRSTILPASIGQNFLIYNGKTFITLKVSEEMVGHKFGEFSNTRRKAIHKKKVSSKKTKK